MTYKHGINMDQQHLIYSLAGRTCLHSETIDILI